MGAREARPQQQPDSLQCCGQQRGELTKATSSLRGSQCDPPHTAGCLGLLSREQVTPMGAMAMIYNYLPDSEEQLTRDRQTLSALFVAKMMSGVTKTIFTVGTVTLALLSL